MIMETCLSHFLATSSLGSHRGATTWILPFGPLSVMLVTISRLTLSLEVEWGGISGCSSPRLDMLLGRCVLLPPESGPICFASSLVPPLKVCPLLVSVDGSPPKAGIIEECDKCLSGVFNLCSYWVDRAETDVTCLLMCLVCRGT